MEREYLTKLIGMNIRKYRLQKDMSQETLSLTAGLHSAYIGKLERGEKCPTVDTLYKICEAVDVSVCEMLSFDIDDITPETQVMLRIENAIKNLSPSKQIKIVEIVENLADLAEI